MFHAGLMLVIQLSYDIGHSAFVTIACVVGFVKINIGTIHVIIENGHVKLKGDSRGINRFTHIFKC